MADLARRSSGCNEPRLLLLDNNGAGKQRCVCGASGVILSNPSWKACTSGLTDGQDCHETDCPVISFQSLNVTQVSRRNSSLRAPPASRQQLLGIQLVQHIQHLHPHSAWIEHLPTRLGYDAHTDLAALALAESLDYYFGGRVDESRFNAAFVCYDKAVSHLRTSIESTSSDGFDDATLTTVALLAVCAVIMSPHSTTRQKNVFVHWSGLKAVFLTKYQPSRTSDMARAILYNLWDCSFGTACAMGTASPFENGGWMALDPVAAQGMTLDAFNLRKIANLIFIRSPRLISYVRAIRQGSDVIDPRLVKETAALASELYSYQDKPAESALLHRVRVIKTKDSSSAHVVPYSYTFSGVEDFNAAVLYWSMRQFVINLLVTLDNLTPTHLFSLSDGDIREMGIEKQRCATNIMMSWEYAEALGPFETVWVAKGLLQNWLQLRRTDVFKKTPTAVVRAWALPKLNHPFNEWLSENGKESDMDLAAELLVGGPLVGFIAETGLHT